MFHRRDHPDHGGDHPPRYDAFGEHLADIVLHDLAAHFQEGHVGLAVEDRQFQHYPGHQQGAGEVAKQYHAPKAQQAPEVGQGGGGHYRQHGGQGVFGEQLLTRQYHCKEASAVADAGDHLGTVPLRQASVEQAHGHERQPHGQACGQCRPPQCCECTFQFLVALVTNDLVQYCRAGRLAKADFLLLVRRQARGFLALRIAHGRYAPWGCFSTDSRRFH
ncbi:hypothetical protein D3C78_1213840 [compost metagenome]